VPELVTLKTDRLILRPYTLDDAPRVFELAGDLRVARTTVNIPHPYPAGAAETWILTHAQEAAADVALTWAVTSPDTGAVGGVGLRLALRHARAELGYWIGHPYWGRGYATEAAVAVLEHAFERLSLNRVHATHVTRNPASGRVMQKLGMTHEGHMRQHFIRDGHVDDIEAYGIVRADYERLRAANTESKRHA
jgi:[ribosomal protein S5]-alanine N-acetyltransferase